MRDHDPTTGRYVQADPLRLVDGASVYGYARQNPGRLTDPTGRFGVPGAIVGAMAAGYGAYASGACWNQVILAAAFGAVIGGLGGGLTPLGTAAGADVASISGQYLPALLPMGCTTYEMPCLADGLTTAGAAAAGGYFGHILGAGAATGVNNFLFGSSHYATSQGPQITAQIVSEAVGGGVVVGGEYLGTIAGDYAVEAIYGNPN